MVNILYYYFITNYLYKIFYSKYVEVDRFPSLEREKQDTTESAPRSRTPKPQENLTHTREVIFALPTLQLNLKSNHTQPVKLPSPYDIKPTVECSFITEFEDHIFVTVDAEAFFFLHDLITSYILEKDKVVSSRKLMFIIVIFVNCIIFVNLVFYD